MDEKEEEEVDIEEEKDKQKEEEGKEEAYKGEHVCWQERNEDFGTGLTPIGQSTRNTL